MSPDDEASVKDPAVLQQMIESTNYSVRRIGRLASALGAESYLEVGVAAGLTFRAITVPDRTGVDPRFQFDVSAVADDRTLLVGTTSDAYFATLPLTAKFDIIFLDGLHTAEQTYRDLCNALMHAHHRTAILLDDTLPSDPWSAVPDRDRSVRLRELARVPGPNVWHGDVYKVIAMIHSFHPSLDYRTIVGSGNPQTLVWHGVRTEPGPGPLGIEEVGRLGFFDLLDRRELLREATEDDAIDACLTAVLA